MRQILIYLLTPLLLLLAAACEDRLDYPGGDIPEGISTFDVEVGFKNFTPTLGSRSAGNAIKTIETLWMVIYDKEGNFIEKKQIDNFTFKGTDNNTRPDGKPSSEVETGCAKFKLTMPNGWYKMYAVANFDLSCYADTDLDSEEKLASLDFEWSEPDPAKDGDDYTAAAKRNAQMFGYFCEGDSKSTSPNSMDEVACERQIPLASAVAIRGNSTKIHAWLRRAASKLTIAFDTDKLQENVYIYIKSVALRDIPASCSLGKMNEPKSKEELISRGEVIYLAGAKADDDNGKTAHSRWRELASGTIIHGLYSEEYGETEGTKEERKALEHSDAAPALYFYENMQGQGIEGTVSDKRQDVNGNNSQVTFPYGTDEDNEAWKDAKPYGTYVEVEGYYINQGTVRPGRGPIKYRFMLGKDEKIDYDANRNHHYRLTMKFNGFANDVDFHIDYDEEQNPGFFTPDTVYVSYLYNDESKMSVRATPHPGYDLESITAVIVNNEWRPYQAADNLYNSAAWDWQINGTGFYKDGDTKNNGEGYNEVRTAASKLDSIPDDPRSVGRNYGGKCAPNCEYGFLSLRRTQRVIYDWTKSNGFNNPEPLITGMRNLYFGEGAYSDQGKRGKRIFGKTDAGASVIPGVDTPGKEITDNTSGNYYITRRTNKKLTDYVFNIPLFTRAKSMDAWATFSGANCFYEHHRYACIKFVAKFVKKSDNSTLDSYDSPKEYYQVSYTHVLQARRIENPTGVYRKAASGNTTFDVLLTYSMLGADDEGNCFAPIESRGPWSAIIECDPANIISLTNGLETVSGEGEMVTGRTGTNIEFTIKQNGDIDPSVSKGAVVVVRYHNNTCSHRILVRQGYSAISMGSDLKWSTFNVYSKDALCKNPLSPGSLFRRYSSLEWPIAEENNTRDGFGFGEKLTKDSQYIIVGKNYNEEDKKYEPSTTWTAIPHNMSDQTPDNFGQPFTLTRVDGTKVAYRLPSEDEIEELGISLDGDYTSDSNLRKRNYQMGIFYGDGASGTLLDSKAFSFSDPNNTGEPSECGVRGVGCYYFEVNVQNPGTLLPSMQADTRRGNSILFSLGATGHPRRKGRYRNLITNARDAAYGIMRYGGIDGTLTDNDNNNYRPMAWDIGDQRGAAYWISQGTSAKAKKSVALDFNTGNMMTNYLPISEVYLFGDGDTFSWSGPYASDALPIKPVFY